MAARALWGDVLFDEPPCLRPHLLVQVSVPELLKYYSIGTPWLARWQHSAVATSGPASGHPGEVT